MSYDELKKTLCEIGCGDAVLLAPPMDYSGAVVGVSDDGRVVYSYTLMVQCLMDKGMGEDEAMEFIDYNTIRALPYAGRKSPILVYDIGIGGTK